MTGQGQPAAGAAVWSTVFRHVRYENLVAGVSGGVLSNLALHPLDLVKIRFAVSDGLEVRPKYQGILHCLTTIWKTEGLRGLYQGVTPNVWGAGLSWGLYFFFYNAIKSYKTEGRAEQLQPLEYLVSAAEAGAMTLCITNPLWVTKTRLMLQYGGVVNPSQRQYKGMFDALVKIYKYEGVRGLYKWLFLYQCGHGMGEKQFREKGEFTRLQFQRCQPVVVAGQSGTSNSVLRKVMLALHRLSPSPPTHSPLKYHWLLIIYCPACIGVLTACMSVCRIPWNWSYRQL